MYAAKLEASMNVLRFLACSERPLLLDEAAEMIAIHLGDRPHFDICSRLYDVQEILDMCCGLVSITYSTNTAEDERERPGLLCSDRAVYDLIEMCPTPPPLPKHESNVDDSTLTYEMSSDWDQDVARPIPSPPMAPMNDLVIVKGLRLADSSVRDWLLSDYPAKSLSCLASISHISPEDLIAQACIAYLKQQEVTQSLFRAYPLLLYTTDYTLIHICRSHVRSRLLEELCLKLFDINSTYYTQFSYFLSYYDSHRASGDFVRGSETPLYWACSYGTLPLANLLVDHGVDVNALGGYYNSPLVAAMAKGRDSMVMMLLSRNSDISGHRVRCGVSSYGLFDFGVDIDPLQWAVKTRKESAALLLLKSGADPNSTTSPDNSSLFLLCDQDVRMEKEDWGLICMLLNHNADASTNGFHGGAYGDPSYLIPILQAAAIRGRVETVRLLPANGADPNVRSHAFGNALMATVSEIYTEDDTRLQGAVLAETIDLLLAHGARINERVRNCCFLESALEVALYSHRNCGKHIIEVLLSRGADVTLSAGSNGTILQLAIARVPSVTFRENSGYIFRSHYSRGCLECGYADTVAEKMKRRTDIDLVGLILKAGADVNARGGPYRTALHAAAHEGFNEAVELLINLDANAMAYDDHGWTVFDMATTQGNLDCTRVLERHMLNTERSPVSQARYLDALVKAVSHATITMGPDHLSVTAVNAIHLHLEEGVQARSDHPIPPHSHISTLKWWCLGTTYRVEHGGSFALEISNLDDEPCDSIVRRDRGHEKEMIGSHDISGCGIDLQTNRMFYTNNGVRSGRVTKNVIGRLFAMIGIRDRHIHVRANFVQEPFLYKIDEHDWKAMVAEPVMTPVFDRYNKDMGAYAGIGVRLEPLLRQSARTLSKSPCKVIGQGFSSNLKKITAKSKSRWPKKDEVYPKSRFLRPGVIDPTSLQLRTPTQLLKFRILLGNSDLQAVVEAYPKLLKAKLLESEDTVEIFRLLHYGQRSNGKLMPLTAVAEHVKEAVDHYQHRRLPPDPNASLHLISYFKESNQYDDGIEFWHWIVRQDNDYLDLRTYGAALELLALYGQPLAYCEEVYSHGLRRFPESFNEYHLSPGAIVSQLDQPTMIPKTSMGLLQGIIKARLIHGDWRNAYLAMDTALRLHPTQMPSHIFRTILEERPINESYQIFCLICESGSQIKPYDVTWMLNDLVDGQKRGTGNNIDLDIALATLHAIHIYSASGRLLSARHLNILLQCSLTLLPVGGPYDSTYRTESHMDPVALVRQLFSIFISLNISPEISTYNTMIAAAGRLRHEGFLAWTVKALSDSGIASNEITFECLLNAAARTTGAAQVESTWASRDPTIALMPSSWAALARATSCAGNIDFLHDQMKIHNVTDQKSTMRQVRVELAKNKPTDSSELPVIPTPDLHSRCESSVVMLSAALQAFQRLLGHPDFGNLKKQPAVRQSMLSTDDVINEDWQKKLYKELSVDPAVLATLEAEAPADSELLETIQYSGIVESSTGFRFDELRYRNWKGINGLLEHAQIFESRLEQAVDKAIEEGKPWKQIRSMKGISIRGPRRRLLRSQFMDHLADINHMKANPLTETEWRDKILELRRVQRS
ncbi:hypothetical protein MMC18_008072 [Xylographa bjoerkii]|nr:hypothetical protein [Xylographa bjoerkii]